MQGWENLRYGPRTLPPFCDLVQRWACAEIEMLPLMTMAKTQYWQVGLSGSASFWRMPGAPY